MRATPPLADDTRTKLLDSAGQVFAESGYQAATVREICTRAGVNVALVNYHFGDKLELYAAVLRHSIGAPGSGKFEWPETSGTGEHQLHDIILAMLQKIARPLRPSWHYQLMIHEIAQPTPAMASVINETMLPLYDRVRTIVGGMIDRPIDDDKTRLCTHSVMAQVLHYIHSRRVNAQLWPALELTPERISEIAQHITDFSMAYLSMPYLSMTCLSSVKAPARKKK
jgi:AcrR family transcriptional regulator